MSDVCRGCLFEQWTSHVQTANESGEPPKTFVIWLGADRARGAPRMTPSDVGTLRSAQRDEPFYDVAQRHLPAERFQSLVNGGLLHRHPREANFSVRLTPLVSGVGRSASSVVSTAGNVATGVTSTAGNVATDTVSSVEGVFHASRDWVREQKALQRRQEQEAEAAAAAAAAAATPEPECKTCKHVRSVALSELPHDEYVVVGGDQTALIDALGDAVVRYSLQDGDDVAAWLAPKARTEALLAEHPEWAPTRLATATQTVAVESAMAAFNWLTDLRGKAKRAGAELTAPTLPKNPRFDLYRQLYIVRGGGGATPSVEQLRGAGVPSSELAALHGTLLWMAAQASHKKLRTTLAPAMPTDAKQRAAVRARGLAAFEKLYKAKGSVGDAHLADDAERAALKMVSNDAHAVAPTVRTAADALARHEAKVRRAGRRNIVPETFAADAPSGATATPVSVMPRLVPMDGAYRPMYADGGLGAATAADAPYGVPELRPLSADYGAVPPDESLVACKKCGHHKLVTISGATNDDNGAVTNAALAGRVSCPCGGKKPKEGTMACDACGGAKKGPLYEQLVRRVTALPVNDEREMALARRETAAIANGEHGRTRAEVERWLAEDPRRQLRHAAWKQTYDDK